MKTVGPICHLSSFCAALLFETKLFGRDRSLIGLTCLLLLFTAFAMFSGWRWFVFQQNALSTANTYERASWETTVESAQAILSGVQDAPQGWWDNPADIRGFAYYKLLIHATKPPSALVALSVGQSDLLPYYLRVGPGLQTKQQTAYEAEHPRRLLLGRFDPTFVVIFVFPLLLLAATYNALSTERDAGRLAYLAVHGLSPLALVMTRIGLRSALLLFIFIGTVLTGIFITQLPISSSQIAAWLGLSSAYFVFWATLALLVVSLADRAATAALWLAAAWMLLLVIVPGLVNLGANLLHPLPSRTAFVLTQRQAIDEAEQSRAILLGRYLHDHPELSTVDTENGTVFRFAANIAADAYVEQKLSVVQNHFDDQLQLQQKLINRWQWFSPAIAVQLTMSDIAGSGHDRHRRFLDQIKAYTQELRAFFFPRIMRGEYRFDAFDDVPKWDSEAAQNDPPQSSIIRCLSALISISALFIAFAVRRLKHVSGI